MQLPYFYLILKIKLARINLAVHSRVYSGLCMRINSLKRNGPSCFMRNCNQ